MGMDAKPRECTNATNIHLRVQTVQTCMLQTSCHTVKKKACMYMRTHTHTKAQQFQTKMFREDSA